MSPKQRTEGVTNNDPSDNGSSACCRRDIDGLSQTTELALESAKAILDRYDDVVSKAHRETALLLWRGITPPVLDEYLGSSLDVTTRAVVAAFSQGLALTEIAAKLQLEGLALLRRMAAESIAATRLPQSYAGTKRGSL
jgi:hypothetical protein